MEYPKTRDEWLALRHKHISSTEVAALFGLSPYMTAFELAVVKKQPTHDNEYVDFVENERTLWGTAQQDAIARRIMEVYGVKVRRITGYAIDGFLAARMGASFDYEIIGVTDVKIDDETLRIMYANNGPGILEIKNVDRFVFSSQWIDGDAPAHIELQVQHQLSAIARTWAAIGALIGGNKLHLLVRERDHDVNMAIRKRCIAFWDTLAAGKMPPIELPADAEIIAKLYKFAEPGKVLDAQGDAEITMLGQEYLAAAKAAKEAGERMDSAKAKLLMKIGDAEKVLGKWFTISASMVAESEIAYTRKAYRGFRVTAKKSKPPPTIQEPVTQESVSA